jgi:hypothetical protein
VRFTQERKLHMLDRLAWSDMFETFLANKYTAAKRFGLEGCETLIPGMKAMIDRAADMGVQCVVMGMPHRGTASTRQQQGPTWLAFLLARLAVAHVQQPLPACNTPLHASYIITKSCMLQRKLSARWSRED